MNQERGSALVLALFVLALLTGMGTALLFRSQHEARMGKASLRSKQAFYMAEAGIEDGRVTLYNLNTNTDLSDDLVAIAVDGTIDFDPDNLQVNFDSDGTASSLSGFNDDIPLRGLTTISDATTRTTGWYAAFMTNDPPDGVDQTSDSNSRVMITGVGGSRDASVEVVQAIVEPYRFLPEVPSAAITMLGPMPIYDNGTASAQSNSGNDCGQSGGAYAPVVGAIGATATGSVVDGAHNLDPEHFDSGPFGGTGTIGDLTDPTDPIVDQSGHGTIEPAWTDCLSLKALVLKLASTADFYCNSDSGSCALPATIAPDDIVFIDGDLANTPNGSYTGILVVTGRLTYKGQTDWEGVLLVIGEGSLERSGGGNGLPSGSVIIANIDPTPNGPNVAKADWCSSSPDGFLQADYQVSGAGSSEVQWCTGNINNANSIRTYRVVEFLQR
jgi:Tfp pilus assembly protein PilX